MSDKKVDWVSDDLDKPPLHEGDTTPRTADFEDVYTVTLCGHCFRKLSDCLFTCQKEENV